MESELASIDRDRLVIILKQEWNSSVLIFACIHSRFKVSDFI